MEPVKVITPEKSDVRLSSEPAFGKEPSNKAIKGGAIAVLTVVAGAILLNDGSPVQAENPDGGWLPTKTPTRTKTPTPRPTNTALPTATRALATETPRPTATRIPATETPRPTATRVPATETPVPPTSTPTKAPTATPRPTDVPPTATIIATIDSTPTLIPTKTKVLPTVTPVSTKEIKPTPTKKKPTSTPTKKKPTATPTRKPIATATRRPTPRPTATPKMEIFPTPKVIMLPHTGEDQRFLDEQNFINSSERFVTDELYNELVAEELDDEILGSVDFLPEENSNAAIDPSDAIKLFVAGIALTCAGGLAASRRKKQ